MPKYFRRLVLGLLLCFVLPHLSRGAGSSLGNDNPTGVTGEYNGSITTGCGVDPYTGNGKRVVTDLTVTGSLGAYPLKWTRILNTRAGAGGLRNSYEWGLWLRLWHPEIPGEPTWTSPSGILYYPDGRRTEYDVDAANQYTQRSLEPGDMLMPAPAAGPYHYHLWLADGGRVEFEPDNNTPDPDGYILRARKIVDPHGLETILSYEVVDGKNRLKKIIEPGGRYLEIEYYTFDDPSPPFPWGNGGRHYTTVILHVKAFAGPGWPETERVTYHYDTVTTPEGGRSHRLDRVDYADGAQAFYTYFPIHPLPMPGVTPPPEQILSGRIRTMDDPRFTGAMGKLEYDYLIRTENHNRPVVMGQVQRELYPGNPSTVVTEIEYPDDIPSSETLPEHARKERRPDGSIRSFQYSNDGKGELMTYTDFKNQTSTIVWPGWEETQLYTRVVTDARLNTTTVEREWSVGAITKIIYPREPDEPDRKFVLFGYNTPTHLDDYPYYLTSKTDELGKVTSYTRHPANHPNKRMIERIDYPDGGWESFTYNQFNQVLSHRMTSGGTEEYRYDERGLKIRSWPPVTSSDGNELPVNYPTRYFYYQSGIHTDRLRYVIDPRGKTTEYEYNGRGQVTKVIFQPDNTFTESFYKPDGTLEWTKDELGHFTRYVHDEYKRVTKVTNHLNESVTASYAPWNGRGALSHTTSSVYRTETHMAKKTDHEYDENFRRRWTKQASETEDWALAEFTYDPVGNLETVKDPRGKFTTYGYNGRNRQIWVRNDELNETTQFRYDAAGNRVKEIRPDGVFRSWDYDNMNRLWHAYDWRTKETASPEQTTTYVRDHAGNATSVFDTKGAEYIYAFDDLNRKEAATYPADANGAQRTEIWRYDRAGNLNFYQNPAGQKKHIEYDDRNRAWHSWWEGGPAVGQAIFTGYDLAGRVEWIETRATNGSMVTRVAFKYDDANRKIWEDQTLAGHPTRRVNTPLDQDGRRQMLEIVEPPQQGGTIGGSLIFSPEMAGSGRYSLAYTYTERNQVKTISGTDQAGEDWAFNYTYDPSGNMIERRADYNGQTSATQCPGENCYDSLNRPLRWKQSGPNGFQALSHYRYDRANREEATWREEDGNLGEHFTYEKTNQLKRVSYKGAIPPSSPTPTPPSGTPTPTPPPGEQVEAVEFNQSGQPPNILLGLNTNTQGAIILCTSSSGAPVPPTHSNGTPTGNTFVYHGPISVPEGEWYFQALAYKAGMIDSEITEWTVYNGGAAPGAVQRVVTYNYTADKLNRSSVHDTAAGQTTSYTPNALNQYTSVGGASYNYDTKFNLTYADGFSAVYDAANRMVAASNSSIQSVNADVELVYDGLGRCVKRTTYDGPVEISTVIIYDGWKPIAEWDGWTDDYFQAWNVYGPGADEILLRQGGKWGYLLYHSDANGNVAFLLNNDGEPVEKYTYDVFGRPKITDRYGNPLAFSYYDNRFMFQGREYIGELGVYDYRHRFYHPEIGRFLQVDPTGFDAGDMNLFRYCGDDPIDGSDPMGLVGEYQRLTSDQGGEWISGANGLSDIDKMNHFSAGVITMAGAFKEPEGNKNEGNNEGQKSLLRARTTIEHDEKFELSSDQLYVAGHAANAKTSRKLEAPTVQIGKDGVIEYNQTVTSLTTFKHPINHADVAKEMRRVESVRCAG